MLGKPSRGDLSPSLIYASCPTFILVMPSQRLHQHLELFELELAAAILVDCFEEVIYLIFWRLLQQGQQLFQLALVQASALIGVE